MNLLVSDISLHQPLPQGGENRYIDLNRLNISNCIGCFGCWVKTPGKCVIRDDAAGVYPLIAESKKLLYVSRIWCGSYDTPMKALLERSIPIQQAFLRLYQGETHHVQRKVAEKDAVIVAYGCSSEEERALFRRVVERNASNMLFRSWNIRFTSLEEIEAAVWQEVQKWENC